MPAVFKKIAIVGGGTMGLGIAHVVASSGIDVVLDELDRARADEVARDLESRLDAEIAKWSMTEGEKRAVMKRVRFTWEKGAIGPVDLVIECVPEKMELKRRVFRQLEDALGPDVIKVTHTGTLSVSEIASELKKPSRAIGLHFLHPAHKVPVVEIIRGLATSDETFQAVRELVKHVGKKPIEVTEYPGYVTTRGIVPLLNESMYMVMEGVASAADVDNALRLGFGFELGPLAMADRIGLDEVLLWMESLHRELGEMKYRPCPLLRKMVRAGQLGVKSGKGFFTYQETGEDDLEEDPA